VEEIAEIYIQGDKKKKLKSHKCPVLGGMLLLIQTAKWLIDFNMKK
jgi:hypothetical protein